MKQIEIKDTYIVIQKSLIKKICKSLFFAFIAALSAFYLFCEGISIAYDIYDITDIDLIRNIKIIALCDITLLCSGKIIGYFTEHKKWRSKVLTMLYLILSILWGLHYFGIQRYSMITPSWIDEWGFTENLILMYSVHIALTIVIFTTTLLVKFMWGKIKRKLDITPEETDKAV